MRQTIGSAQELPRQPKLLFFLSAVHERPGADRASIAPLCAIHVRKMPMKHAGQAALLELEDVLIELRRIPGWIEMKPGIFTIKRRSMLHFHEDPAGMFADLRETEEFVRLPVTSAVEKRELIERATRMVEKRLSLRGSFSVVAR